MNLRKDHYRDETERTPREESAGGGGVEETAEVLPSHGPLARTHRRTGVAPRTALRRGGGPPDPSPRTRSRLPSSVCGVSGPALSGTVPPPPPPPRGLLRPAAVLERRRTGESRRGGGVWGGPAPGARSGPPGRLRGADRGAAGRKNGSPVCRGESEGAARETGRRRETSPRAGAPVGGGRRDLDS